MERSDFAAFFAALNGGCGPFRWQERLLDSLLENGRWPERIAAPTGAGKTSAIDVHVFAVALTADGCGPRLPRRLAMVVDRRVLVDDQYQRARALAAALARSRARRCRRGSGPPGWPALACGRCRGSASRQGPRAVSAGHRAASRRGAAVPVLARSSGRVRRAVRHAGHVGQPAPVRRLRHPRARRPARGRAARIRLGGRGRRGAPGRPAPGHRPPGLPAGHGRAGAGDRRPGAAGRRGHRHSRARRSRGISDGRSRRPRRGAARGPADQVQAGHLDPGSRLGRAGQAREDRGSCRRRRGGDGGRCGRSRWRGPHGRLLRQHRPDGRRGLRDAPRPQARRPAAAGRDDLRPGPPR